jgi:hypothetical protein
MAEVGIIWAQAPTLEKLQTELAGLLDGYAAEDVLGVSHSTGTVSTKQSGGIWGAGTQNHKLDYTAVVLVRNR